MDASAALPVPPNPQALNCTTFDPPPVDGSLCIPQMVDWNMAHNGSHPLFRFTTPSTMREICWEEVAFAVHRAARHILNLLGPPSTDNSVISIIAATDAIAFFTFVNGALRAGYQPFPISTRNSADAVAYLLKQTDSRTVFVSSDDAMQTLTRDSIKGLGEKVAVHPMPQFDEVYPEDVRQAELLPPMERPGLDEIGLVLHSSGSSSFPKPIYITHRMLLTWTRVPWYGEVDLCGAIISLHGLPLFHAYAQISFTFPHSTGAVIATYRPSTPPIMPTPQNFYEELQAIDCTVVITVPIIIEAWARDPEKIKRLSKVKAILYGGSSLSKSVGDMLSANGVRVTPGYGSTEVGPFLTVLSREPAREEDWEYFVLSRHLSAHLIPQNDGTSAAEICIMSTDFYRPAVINTEIDGKAAYATNDLVIPHPTKPRTYKVYGRVDDQIALSSGEKTNPIPIESILMTDPRIRYPIVFGNGKFQNGILVEPAPAYSFDPSDEAALSEYRNEIWPTVERANASAPSHSRLFKEMIVVASPSKPFTYTIKGTPRRKAVLTEYADEIEAAYTALEESARSEVDAPADWDETSILDFVRKVVQGVLGKEVSDVVDIFQHGCDSLQATHVRNAIMRTLRAANFNTSPIQQSFVYENPKIAALAKFILDVVAPNPASNPSHPDSGTGATRARSSKEKEIESLIAELTSSFPARDVSNGTSRLESAGESEVILLTGSTGGLGAAILAQLLTTPSVSRVYALNRRSGNGKALKARHAEVFAERGLDAALLESAKVVLVEGDTAVEKLGTSKELYEEIRDKVTCIMHIAWKVDFNLAFSSFEPLVRGVRNLVDLSFQSPRSSPPRLLFASSVGVLRNWEKDEPALEEPIHDIRVPLGSGYSESKWAVERILEIAAEKTALRPVVVRIGQLCGSSNGCWNRSEWVPSVVRSGEVLGCLPDCQDVISWIPTTNAASAIIEFRHSSFQIVHLAHPKPVDWSIVFKRIATSLDVKLVPYSEWLTALETRLQTAPSEVEEAKHNPAVLLLDTFSKYRGAQTPGREAMGVVKLDLRKTREAARFVFNDANLPQIGIQDVDRWLEYWQRIGLLRSE